MAKLLVEFECNEDTPEEPGYLKFFDEDTGKWMQQAQYDLLTGPEKVSFSTYMRRKDPVARAAHSATMSAINKGRKLTEEHKAKKSSALKGRKLTEKHKAKLIAANTGKKRSDESRARISASMKGKKRPPRSEEHQARISAALKGKKHSEEHKAKVAASKSKPVIGPDGTEYKSAKEAARITGTSYGTMNDWCRYGKKGWRMAHSPEKLEEAP